MRIISDNIIVHDEIDFTNCPMPDKALDCGGMVSEEERNLLYHLAKNKFIGRGKIIDGGSFFGSTAVALATGLQDNNRISNNDLEKNY